MVGDGDEVVMKGNETTVEAVVDPGICGFACKISVEKTGKRSVKISLSSECEQITDLAMKVPRLDMKDIFKPLSRNPVFVSAEESHCHTVCVIPSCILKCAEVALALALPKNVSFRFVEQHNP
ncbi:MAG: hypothetical protein JRI80_08475 [Deltaproteobacteria bacterium]|nr:hypothetical protein [Deltaproteobacteria bacterium]